MGNDPRHDHPFPETDSKDEVDPWWNVWADADDTELQRMLNYYWITVNQVQANLTRPPADDVWNWLGRARRLSPLVSRHKLSGIGDTTAWQAVEWDRWLGRLYNAYIKSQEKPRSRIEARREFHSE